jgi:hypothetical protein
LRMGLAVTLTVGADAGEVRLDGMGCHRRTALGRK